MTSDVSLLVTPCSQVDAVAGDIPAAAATAPTLPKLSRVQAMGFLCIASCEGSVRAASRASRKSPAERS